METDHDPSVDPPGPTVPTDDPSLHLAPKPSRTLRPLPIIVAVSIVTLLGGAAVFALHASTRTTITEEPHKAILDRTPVTPSFIATVPATPTPVAPADSPKPPAAPGPSFSPPPLPSRPAVDPEVARARAREAELEDQARSAGIFFHTEGQNPSAAPTRSTSPAEPRLPLPAGGGGELALSAGAGAAAAAALNPDDPNLQDHKNSFLNSPRSSPDYLATSLQEPISPYELKAGSIIPVTLIDALNSDLPGPVTAQVRERVYDTVTGDHLLIPQGTRLTGSYDSKVAWGQERVLLCWDRLIFPNGTSINLHCMPASDLQGQAGLTDKVDNHWDRLMAAVGLSTVLSLGTQAIAGDPTSYQPTLTQRAASSAAGQINGAGQAFVSRQLNLQPTITIRPGFSGNLRVTKDIVLRPYVEDSIASTSE